MCGVLGVFGYTDLIKIGKMLNFLTHRGQDASGIAWISNDELKIVKERGYPSDLHLPLEKPLAAIGSTRYPTYGIRIPSDASLDKFAQPFSFETSNGTVSAVHNGQIVNIGELSSEFYLSDSEMICKMLSEEIEKKEGDLLAVVKELMLSLDGSYSEISLINKNQDPTMIVFRDPLGIRPLIMGKIENSYVFSSESIAIEQLGGKIIRDVNPGELIILKLINNEIKIDYHQIITDKEHKQCMFEYVYFASPSSVLDKVPIYEARTNLGRALGKEVMKRGIDKIVDFIVPVPDSSRIAAQSISEMLKKPMREAILKNRYHTSRTFILNSDGERNKAIESKYHYVKHLIENKALLVIDDSIVRGKTAKRIIQKLKSFGAKKIIFASTCPPLIRPCYYGIDAASDSEFIALNKSFNEIQEILGADLIIYQGIGDLYEAIGKYDLCTACITGDYPTKAGKNLRKLLKEGKIGKDLPHYEQLMGVKKMKILLVGNGAREHAIAKKLIESGAELISFMNKRNPGIANISSKVVLGEYSDHELIKREFSNVDLAFIGPENPLADGIVDFLELELGITTVGPRKSSARLESSKAFTRELLTKYNIEGNPSYAICKNKTEILNFLKDFPEVAIKPDVLTGGKGVRVSGEHLKTKEEIINYALERIEKDKYVVIEEKLNGKEFSLQAFVDKNLNIIPMPMVQDFKRAYDNDEGPNTGSMGSYSCANHRLPFVTDKIYNTSLDIMKNTINALKEETNENYKGILYGQFMINNGDPKLIEYNCRFGDPEAINVLELLQTNLVDISKQIINGTLVDAKFEDKATTCVYVVPEGYPTDPISDHPININNNKLDSNYYFASVYGNNSQIKTTNSRSIAIVSTGKSVREARKSVYEQLDKDVITGRVFYRKDIASKIE